MSSTYHCLACGEALARETPDRVRPNGRQRSYGLELKKAFAFSFREFKRRLPAGREDVGLDGGHEVLDFLFNSLEAYRFPKAVSTEYRASTPDAS